LRAAGARPWRVDRVPGKYSVVTFLLFSNEPFVPLQTRIRLPDNAAF